MILRSPKWLRNLIDFEIQTGEDIKGVPSKRRLKKIAKEREQELIRIANEKEIARKKALKAKRKAREKRWSDRWDESGSSSEFREFYRNTYNNGKFSGMPYMHKVKETWFGDMNLWVNYDHYIKKIKAEEREQERIKDELNRLYDSILHDYKRAKYTDKVDTPRNRYTGNIKIIYTFENGDVFEMDDNTIIFGKHTYTVGISFRNKFISFFNMLIEDLNINGKRRPTSKKRRKASNGKSKSYSHPKMGLYETLKETIKQRKEQLKKMGKNDTERSGLENELDTAERQVAKMKKKYNF